MGRHLPPLRVWLWAAATVALVAVAVVLWRGSDAAATESTTAEPATVPEGAPDAVVSAQWSAPSDPMPDDVVESGRVLVAGRHGVRALDLLTGEEAWRYVRGNAVLCDVAVTDGVAVAVFGTADRCDEAVALDADTGVRAWTRSVSFAGDVVLDSTDGIVLAVGSRSLVTLDPTGNNVRWRYEAPERCRVLAAEAGEAGVALLQRCAGSPAVQLRLLDGFEGDARWSRDLAAAADDDVRLLGADRLVGVAVGPEVTLLAGDDGAARQTLTVAGEPELTSVGAAVLLLADGVLRAYDPATAAPLWEAAALGLPGDRPVDGADAVVVPEASGFVLRDAVTGQPSGPPVSAADLAPGGRATIVGPVVVHRSGDEVTAYG